MTATDRPVPPTPQEVHVVNTGQEQVPPWVGQVADSMRLDGTLPPVVVRQGHGWRITVEVEGGSTIYTAFVRESGRVGRLRVWLRQMAGLNPVTVRRVK